MFNEVSYIKSTIDNKVYMIRRGQTKSPEFLQQSADTLAKINARVQKLIEHLDTIYSKDSTKNYFITKLKNNYNPYMISEAAIDKRYTSYTINKKNMHLCLRTRDQYEQVYDINLLMYVTLHELAHVSNYNQNGYSIEGHGEEFKMIFGFLVKEAINIGIYQYENYTRNPKEYCGIVLNSNII
jgi:predicted SprT family Zn-dependent metalloprotease